MLWDSIIADCPLCSLRKKLIEEGRLGKITQFRTSFLEDWGANAEMAFTWRYKKATSGGGALADLGSHIIDVARFLIGEIKSVCGMQDTFIKNRKVSGDANKAENVDVDDYTTALVRFENGIPGNAGDFLGNARKKSVVAGGGERHGRFALLRFRKSQ